MRGRKPKPVELRVLHGSAAERARAEHPQPRRVLPRCPEFLTGEAERCWKRLARELYDAGLLTAVDRDALATYCAAFARWRKAEDLLAKSGEIIRTEIKTELDANGNKVVTGGGNVIQNPWLAISNKAQETMNKLAAEFGMTPSSRSRVKAEQSFAKKQVSVERGPVVKVDPANDPRRVLES